MGAMETWTTLLLMLAVTMVTSGQMQSPEDLPDESSLPSCIRAHIQAAFRLEEGHGALVHIPRCDDRLMWQEIQCMDQLGLCWCVNTTTGDRTSAAVVGQPDCSTMAALPRDVETMPGAPVCPGGRTPTVCAVSTCVRTGCAGAALCRADPCNQCRPVFTRQDGAVITDCQSQGSTCEREMVSVYDDLLRDLSQDHQVYTCTLNRLVLRYTATGLFTGLRLPERNLTILQEVVEHCRACADRPPPPPWRNNLDDLDESSSEDSDYTLEDDDDDDDTTMEDDEDDDDDSKGKLEQSSETSSTESKDDDDDDDSKDDDDDSEDNPMGRPPPGRGPVISRGPGGPVLHREGPPQGPPPGPPLDDPAELAGLLPILGMLLRISSADDLLARKGSRLRSDAGMQKPGFCPMMGATGSMVNCSRGSDATCSGIEKCCPDVSGGMRCVNPKLLTSGLILPKCRPDDDLTHGGYQYKQCFSALMSICACVDPVGNIRSDTIRVGGNLTCGPNGILFEESARRVQCPGNVQPSVCKSACRRQVSCESPPRGGSVTCLADMCDCSAVIYAPSRTTDVTRGVLSGHVMDAYLPPSGQLTAMLRRALAFYVRGLLARMSSGPMYPPMGLPNRPSGQRPSRPGQGGSRPNPPMGNGPPAPRASRPPPPGSNSPPNPQRPGTQPGLPGPPAPVGTPGTVNDQQHNPPPLGGNLPDWLLPENFLPRSEQRPDPTIPPSKMEVMRGELALRFFRRGLLLVIKLELFPILEALPVDTLGMDLALLREWVDRLLVADRRGGMAPPEEDDTWTPAGPTGRGGPPPGGRGPQGRGRGPPGGAGPARGAGARGNHTRGAPSPPGVRTPGQGPPPRRGPPRGKGPLLNCTVVSSIPDICSLPAPRRECMQENNMTVYYYDPNRDTCVSMTGVCKEERHKFRTMSECLQRCAGVLCPGQTPRVCPTYSCHLRAFCRALPEAICTVDPCSCEQVFHDPITRDRVACNDTEAFGLCSRFRASARREHTMMKVLGQCTGPPAPAPPPHMPPPGQGPPPGWMPPPGQGQPPPGWMPPPGQGQPPPGWMPPPGQGQPPPGWMPPPGQGQPPPGWMPPPGQGQPPPGWTPPPGQRLPPAPAPPPQGGQGRGAGRRGGGGPTQRGMGGVRGSWKELASQARPEDIQCEQNLFSPMQCSQQSCWCVNPVGQSVMGRPQGGSLKCPNHRLRRVDFAIAFNGSINLIGDKDLFMRSMEQALNTRPGPLRNMMKIVDVIPGSIIVVGEIDLRQTQDTNAYLAPLSQMEDEIEAELLVVRHEQLVLVATPGRTVVDLEFVEEVEIIEIENPVPSTSAPTSKPTTSVTDGKGKGSGDGDGKPGGGGHGNDLMDGEQKEEVPPSTMSVGLLVGIIVGGAVLGLLIILTIFMCVRRIKTRSPKDKSAEAYASNGNPDKIAL